MATSPRSQVIQQVCKLVFADELGLTDAQLLERFIAHRDDAAFEAMVRRHGPMVLAVCQRVLSDYHDAEDAFQATFLVLVRKAASIVPREMVGNWLYGVAYQTAVRAKVANAKRRAREKQVQVMPDPVAPPDLRQDLRPLLDQELSRLPAKYRVPIVLCDLEGKSHREAARQLGWPIETVSGRLARARKLLAARLARRGLALALGSLAVVLPQSAAPACIPPSLLAATIKAASAMAAGKAVAAGMISANVAGLSTLFSRSARRSLV